MRDVRRLGTQGVLDRIPKNRQYYITIDIDGFDPSIAPGTGTPSHGGFLYYEVMEIIRGVARQGEVVGVDLVEVAPPYDPANVTSILAAQVLMNTWATSFTKGRDEATSDASANFWPPCRRPWRPQRRGCLYTENDSFPGRGFSSVRRSSNPVLFTAGLRQIREGQRRRHVHL